MPYSVTLSTEDIRNRIGHPRFLQVGLLASSTSNKTMVVAAV